MLGARAAEHPARTGAGERVPATSPRFWVTCYTDASFSREGGGWAVWLRSERGRVVRRGACPAYTRSANEAELAAIFAALYLARKTWGPAVRGLVVKTDSQAAISLLRTAVLSDRVRRRAPGAARLHERIRGFAIEHGIELELRWVQGHQKTNTMRAYLNAQCDRLAREARRALKQAVRPASGTGDSAVAAPGPSPPVVSLHRSRKQKRRERRARARAKKRRAMLRVLP